MTRLSAFPKGLLAIVGAQNFGINPKDLAETIVPVVDLTELYLVDKIDSPNAGLAAVATGFNSLTAPADTLLVPQGEIWRVFAFACSAITGVGAAVTYAPAVQINGGRFQISDPRTVAASVTDWNVMDVDPFWLPAGARLGVEVQQLTAGVGMSAQALISRVRA